MSYEEKIALPTMRQWLDEPMPQSVSQEEDARLEELAWNNGEGHSMAALTQALISVRAQEILLLGELRESALTDLVRLSGEYTPCNGF